MPAKGWRKDEQESNIDTVLHNENLSIDSFAFPKSLINRISKQVLSESDPETKFLFAKDSQTLIQRACILFINFIYHHAKQLVKRQNRKVVNADDIINALSQVGFHDFEIILRNELQSYETKKDAKRHAKAVAKMNADANIEDANVQQPEVSDSSKRIRLNEPSASVNNPLVVEQEEEVEEEDEQMEDDNENDDDDDDGTDLEEAEPQTLPHQPSQLELEQKELAGDDPDKVEVSTADILPNADNDVDGDADAITDGI